MKTKRPLTTSSLFTMYTKMLCSYCHHFCPNCSTWNTSS